MPRTLQVSDETFEMVDAIREAASLRSDTVVRYAIFGTFPSAEGVLRGEDPEKTECGIIQELADFLSRCTSEGTIEFDGWTKKVLP